jgi:hypothetical protein
LHDIAAANGESSGAAQTTYLGSAVYNIKLNARLISSISTGGIPIIKCRF